jgi:hypothetical protein
LDNRLDIDRSSYNVRAYGPRPVNGSFNGHYHPAQSDKPSSGLSVIALGAFMTQQLAPREMVLDPIIAVRSLCLLLRIAALARRWSRSTSPGPSPVAGASSGGLPQSRDAFSMSTVECRSSFFRSEPGR